MLMKDVHTIFTISLDGAFQKKKDNRKKEANK